jgi:hypothetical protein
MDSKPMPRSGGSRCAKVRFEISAPPMLTLACHCEGCQRISASAYSLSAIIPAAAFTISEGTVQRGGMKGDDIHHYFCGDCMTWLYTQNVGLDEFVNIRPSMLDDSSGFEPFAEVFAKEKMGWVTTPAIRSYETEPSMQEFGGLIEEYKF